MRQNNPMFAPTLGAAAFGGLIAGVVAGATMATVNSAREVKEGKKTKKEAVADIIREAGSMGLATTVGVTATAILGIGGVLSIAGVALFTAGSKYTIDSLLLSCPQKVKEESVEKNMEKEHTAKETA